MSSVRDRAETEVDELDALFGCLANGDRRRILGRLHEKAPGSVTKRDLATYLVPHYSEKPHEEMVDGAVQRALTLVHHTHLPKLAAVDLIDREGGSITLTDHPAFADAGIVDIITDEPSDSAVVDALFRALADAQRRTILDVLSHQFGPIHAETLARELIAEERGNTESNVPADDVERTLVALRHNHLPHLSDAGLIEYDAVELRIAYQGHPRLRVPWIHSVLEPEFRATLTGESDPRDVGTIEGREQVVSFGQSLCDRVEEELFCMFTETDLLEAGCFTRIRTAARRGVDVYLGTRDPTVREYVTENAPEVVLWEPNTDWFDLPVQGSNVGRLLLADREAIMLGTLGETRGDVREERAIVAEGADNTLVVMVRQLLEPHLGRIDERSENIEANLPF